MERQSQTGIFSIDANLVVRTWDDWMALATSLPAAAVVGRRLTDVIPEIEARGLLARVHDVLSNGVVEVLAPALHHFLIACPPLRPSTVFDRMQQRVTIGPLRQGDDIVGVMFAVEEVTPRLEAERALAAALASDDWRARYAAVDELSRHAGEGFIIALLDNVRRDHRDFSVLSSALKLLATTDVDATAPLAALLRDSDADLRIQAALSLGDQQHSAAIDALLAALDDPDANVRFHVVESLGRLRAEAAIDPLLAIVASRDFFVSFVALDALTAINDPRVAPDLVPLLADSGLRVPVAEALGALGDDRTIRPLIEVLNASPEAVQPIADAVVRIHDRYERDYGDGTRIAELVREGVSPDARHQIVRSLNSTAVEQLRSLVRMVGWLDGDEVERALAELLSQPSLRAEVTEALVRHGDRVVDLLIETLASTSDDDTRQALVVALGRVGSRRATAALTGLFGESRELLIAAAGALARIADPAAFEPLLSLLAHPDGAVRQAAIGALNSIGHPDLPARVAALLDDAEPLIRESAVKIAGYFGYRETTDRLFACATDRHESVRRAALEHLPYMDDARVTPTLESALAHDTAPARAAATRALGHVDEPAARAALLRALADPDAWVRYYAARGLTEQRHRDAVPALVGHAQRDEAAPVRIAAIDALGVLADLAVVPTLRELAGDEHADVAAAALTALGQLAVADGLGQLRDALRGDDAARRLAAVRGLAANGSADAVAALEWAAGADHDHSVGDAAMEALGAIAARNEAGADTAVQALIGILADPARREEASTVLSRLPAASIDAVAAGLNDTRSDVRRAIVDVLGRFQRFESSRFVEGALKDSAAVVRQAAVQVLTRLGARTAEPVFAELAVSDPSKAVRRAAAEALAQARAIGPV